ncbi:MAG: aminotransferase class V-fold PLP-dependent enzyme [Lachnospiraceae bacterium]|nr:aminotransferase class V-fold PLP-dependent enzyme [Lachnospiraceae bacterium]
MSTEKSLYQTLAEYSAEDFYPCHMPGHKRNLASGEMADFYRIDITEIDGFDDLHHAEGILRKAQERANRLYGAEETFFLVNGSTCGVLAAILAVTEPGEEILIARNCHKSVYHAAILQSLSVHYYQPQMIQEYDICDGVCAEEIERLLDQYPGVKAVVITSPTYEGILSDIAGIAHTVHKRGKVLIVDEAHGAHLGLAKNLPEGAVAQGADLVIHSLHKTLPAMTQTALLHRNGDRVDRERLHRYLTMLQSSSPSYVLMASMDACVRFLEEEGAGKFAFFQKEYEKFCEKTAKCRQIKIGKMTNVSENYAMTGWDIGKILISVKDTKLNGKELSDLLRERYHLEMEMAADTYALAIMTLMDMREGWQRLADALCDIDDRIEKESCDRPEMTEGVRRITLPQIGSSMAAAFHSPREEISLREAAGRIAADFLMLYPPGIPLAAPGEVLDEELIQKIENSREKGLSLRGVSSEGRIPVVVEIP